METQTDVRPLQVGDFLSYSWGYDQTNVDFYKVVRTSEKSVWLQRVYGAHVEGSEGFMSARVVPTDTPYERFGETMPVIRKARKTGWQGDEIVVFDHGVGTRVKEGETLYASWYG